MKRAGSLLFQPLLEASLVEVTGSRQPLEHDDPVGVGPEKSVRHSLWGSCTCRGTIETPAAVAAQSPTDSEAGDVAGVTGRSRIRGPRPVVRVRADQASWHRRP